MLAVCGIADICPCMYSTLYSKPDNFNGHDKPKILKIVNADLSKRINSLYINVIDG